MCRFLAGMQHMIHAQGEVCLSGTHGRKSWIYNSTETALPCVHPAFVPLPALGGNSGHPWSVVKVALSALV